MSNDREISLGVPGVRRRSRLAVAVLAVLALLGAACSDDDGATTTDGDSASTDGGGAGEEVLGEPAPASGEPVKVGFIHDGKSPVRDATVDRQVAEATSEYLNDYRSGLAGRPIELVECEALAEPSRAVDCANQMVQEEVAAVVIGAFSNLEAIFDPIHAAGIPMMVWAGVGQTVLADPDSTFVLTNSFFGLADLPISVAKDAGVDKVNVVVIDLPITTSFYKAAGKAYFGAEDIDMNLITIPPGTADMTPQMQAIAGDDALVHVIGNDAFCIAAFNGLKATGFDGPVSTVSQCMTDATREQTDPEVLDGMVQQAAAPLGEDDDPDIQLFNAVLDKYAPEDTDRTSAFGVGMFTTLTALVDATEGLSGEVTAATVLAAIKAMPEKDLPAGGGVKFQCNGKALAPLPLPAVCGSGGLRATLDAEGVPASYDLVTKVPDAAAG
ncbi:MAG TPA: ABC transporter substrate-binding protein [Acidimicrobiales bacterium]|nr:ABC transporter substrate-binding protein [Acidimicrobiales bacterium]